MTSLTGNETLLILMMIGILILAGCVMETTPNIVILAPIMLLAREICMQQIHCRTVAAAAATRSRHSSIFTLKT